MRVYNDGNVTVEIPNEIFFTDNKYLLTVTRNNTIVTYLEIPSISARYTIFDDNPMTIDLSDYAKVYSPGSMSLNVRWLGPDDAILGNIEFDTTLYAGAYTNDEIYPLKSYNLCAESDLQPVNIKIHVQVTLQKADNEAWTTITNINAGEWFNGQLEPGDYRVTSTSTGFKEVRFTIGVIEECDKNEYIPVTWTGENGFGKKWLFRKVGEVRNTVDSVELARLNDGFTVHKGKIVQIQVLEDSADIATRKYLADIVYSSNVDTFYITPTNERINVPITVSNSSTTVDLESTHADFAITLNVAQYDNF